MSIKINLTEKNVLITGAGGDIGSAITLKFLEAGANCFCLDKNLRNLKRLKLKKKYLNKIIEFVCDYIKN